MTYTKGQSWYESPKKPHVVSKNASKTEPAKLLVFLLLLKQVGQIVGAINLVALSVRGDEPKPLIIAIAALHVRVMNGDFLVAIRIFLREQSLEVLPNIDYDGSSLLRTCISLLGLRSKRKRAKEDQPGENDKEDRPLVDPQLRCGYIFYSGLFGPGGAIIVWQHTLGTGTGDVLCSANSQHSLHGFACANEVLHFLA